MDNLEREQWLKNRLSGIGGSEASIIMGCNPWKSRLQLWTEKITRILPEEDEDNLNLRWGKLLEPVIANEYSRQTGRILIECKSQMTSEEYPFMNANVDRFITNSKDKDGIGVLEIKTKGIFVDWDENRIPEYYQLQLQHYMAVTGYKWGSFAVFDFAKKDLIIEDVERNEETIKKLIEEESKFWNLVQTKTQPEVDSSECCNSYLKDFYSKEEDGKEIDLRDNIACSDAAVKLLQVKEQIKKLEINETLYKSILMFAMKDAEIGIGDGYKVTWKSPKGKLVFDEESFKKEHQYLWQTYCTLKSQSRRFLIKSNKVSK